MKKNVNIQYVLNLLNLKITREKSLCNVLRKSYLYAYSTLFQSDELSVKKMDRIRSHDLLENL